MHQTSTKPILLTLLLSLVAHSVFFTSWTNDELHIPQAGGQGMTVTLVVQANKAPAPITPKVKPSPQAEPKPASASKPENIKQPPQKKIASVTTKVTAAPNTTTTQENDHAQPETEDLVEPSVPDTTAIQAETSQEQSNQHASFESSNRRLASVLKKAFNAKFYYPRMAVRRGWQGTVQLGLRIEANGKLSDIRIMEGSGYDLLDKAALNTLAKVDVLETAITLLDGRSLELILPVEYRLL